MYLLSGRQGQHEMWTCNRASHTATFSGYGSSDDTSNITRSVVKQRQTICMAACSSSIATIFPINYQSPSICSLHL